IPMVFLLIMTVWAMILNLQQYFQDGNLVLILFGALILVSSIWILIQGYRAFSELQAEGATTRTQEELE
ncbi:MAG: hypothetical protein P8Y60_20820, partial [Calditrichota bacterium]